MKPVAKMLANSKAAGRSAEALLQRFEERKARSGDAREASPRQRRKR